MTLEELLNHYDLKLVVVESRYGGGYFAGIEIEDHPVIETVNDLNGETEWEFYGVRYRNDDNWYPVTWGINVVDAVKALATHLQGWSKEDGTAVYTALNVLRKLDCQPQIGVRVAPVRMIDLKAWMARWDAGEEDETLLVRS